MTETAASSAGPPGSRMVPIFEHVPHPHIAARKEAGPAKTSDQRTKGKGPIGRLNARFGVFITVAVGTMWCAYVFTLLALVSLPAALKSHDQIIIVAWIAQTFLQLVLLPIIIVGQNVQAAASDKRAEDTYKDAEAVLHEALQIQAHLQAQDEILQRLAGGRND
ncbi:MAG: hypothetical protein ACYDDU_12815 [Dermatophilaceae bacterium]